MSNNVEEKILHGTTTVGIKATDGVVLCADMRASAGYFIANNNTMKIQKIEQHVGLTLAGGVADAQNIVDVLRYHANLHRIQNQEPIPVNSLARLTSLMFHQNRGYPFIADILVGGVDAKGPALFNIDMFGSVENKNYVTTGSGSPVAYGLLEEEYNKDLTLEDAKELGFAEGVAGSAGILLEFAVANKVPVNYEVAQFTTHAYAGRILGLWVRPTGLTPPSG